MIRSIALRSPPWFDLPLALLGAVVSGAFVAWINSAHGLCAATTATLKQALYAFVATGLVVQLSRWLASRPLPGVFAAFLAVAVPLCLTATLLFAVHSLKGTPEPLLSTIPGTLLSLLGLLLVTAKTLREGRGATPGPKPAPGSRPR